jgi:hypothetical protein
MNSIPRQFLLNAHQSSHSINLSAAVERAVGHMADSFRAAPYLRRGLAGAVTATFVDLEFNDVLREATVNELGELTCARVITTDRYDRGVWRDATVDDDIFYEITDPRVGRVSGSMFTQNPNPNQSATLEVLASSTGFDMSTRAGANDRIEVLSVHRTEARAVSMFVNHRGVVASAATLDLANVNAFAWHWVRIRPDERRLIDERGVV